MSELNKDKNIPDDVVEAIEFLEDELLTEGAHLQEHEPDQNSAVGEQIAYALRARRLSADLEFIQELKENDQLQRSLDAPEPPSDS